MPTSKKKIKEIIEKEMNNSIYKNLSIEDLQVILRTSNNKSRLLVTQELQSKMEK